MADERNPARELAARRKTHSGLCERCGKPFSGLTKRRYCSKVCGAMAWQAANPELVKASRAKRRRAAKTARKLPT